MPVNLELQWNGPTVMAAFDRQALAALNQAGQIAERTAQGLARVRTGFMRDSVYIVTDVRQSGELVLIVGDSAPYSVFQELGTVFMSGQPFIRPGGDAAAAALPELLARGTQR
jgi:HK97 gp10 family phage protein